MPIIDKRPVNENDIDASYDESGNLLKLNGSQDLHWNYRDNIAYVDIITRPSGKNDSEYYVYDSSGQRVRKVTETYQNNEKNSTQVEKIYFGDIEVTRTYQNNNLNKEKYTVHVMDDKSRIALHHYYTKGSPEEIRESQSRYQLSNHLDSVALELNDGAEIITYEEYLPFGGTALIAGKTAREVTEKEYRYSGKERDDSTGLYYYGARYYAPWLLRWINPDPAGTVDGLNLYLFVGGNSINNVDIGGMMTSRKRSRGRRRGRQGRSGNGSRQEDPMDLYNRMNRQERRRENVPFLTLNERIQQPNYDDRPIGNMEVSLFQGSTRSLTQPIITNSAHGSDRLLSTFARLGAFHGSLASITQGLESNPFQRAANTQDFSGTGGYDAAHVTGPGYNINELFNSNLNSLSLAYLLRQSGRTNLAEGGSSMNRGIEQNIDASQFEIFSEYWAQSLNDENFQQSFEDIRGRMIRSISSGTTREADELRTGMERVTLEDAFSVYRGNFLHANHLSNPLQLGVIYLPINIASTQSNAPENRLIQDQVANDNNDQREETQLIQQQRGRGL